MYYAKIVEVKKREDCVIFVVNYIDDKTDETISNEYSFVNIKEIEIKGLVQKELERINELDKKFKTVKKEYLNMVIKNG